MKERAAMFLGWAAFFSLLLGVLPLLSMAVGYQLEELQHIGQHAHLVNAVCIRVILTRINLRREQDLLAVIHNLFQRANRFFTAHKKRHDHVGENHNVAQRQDGIG